MLRRVWSFSPRLAWFIASATFALAATFEERVELFFRPPTAEQMALSPDGRHVAYTRQAGDELQVIIVDVTNPLPKLTLRVDDARSVPFSKDKEPTRLRFLRWATANRLVFAPTEERITFVAGVSKVIAPIFAVDADGQNPKTLLEGDEFAAEAGSIMPMTSGDTGQYNRPEPLPMFIPRSPQILGFRPGNREQLLLRVPGARQIAGESLVALDLRTGKYTELDGRRLPVALIDSRVPADPQTRLEVDRELARKFPQRRVVMLDWSEGLQHALVRVTGGSDQGRIFIYQRPLNLVLELARVAPWLRSDQLNESRFVDWTPANGPRLTAYVTWPRASRLKPPPVLVVFPSGFPGRPQPEYDGEAQSLADLGFVVLRLNHRYERRVDQDEAVLGAALIDRLSVDDAAAMLQRVATQFPERPMDLKHVATLGRGFGGYLAVRALQLRPEVFRAGVAINAPMDLRSWLYPVIGWAARDIPRELLPEETAPWAQLSVRDQVNALRHPVLFLSDPGKNDAVDRSIADVRSALKRIKRPADYVELDPAFARALPKSRAAVYRKLEEFFNLRLYDYRVKLGPTTEVK